MNDRRVTKLFKKDDALSLDMHPIVIKQCADFYVLSYKNLYMACDVQGICSFESDTLQETSQFVVI